MNSADLFNECTAFQARSHELVIYCISAQRLVTIAWPSHNGGVRILPSGIRSWLRYRELHWPCFCPLSFNEDNKTCSTKIIESKNTGEFLVYCGGTQRDCGFFMNLNQKYNSATLSSDYGTIATPSKSHDYSDLTFRAFRLDHRPDGEMGEYFEGYCGEHVSKFPGVKQRSMESPFSGKTGSRKIHIISLQEATASSAQGPYHTPRHLQPKPTPMLRPYQILHPANNKTYPPPHLSGIAQASSAATRVRRVHSFPIPDQQLRYTLTPPSQKARGSSGTVSAVSTPFAPSQSTSASSSSAVTSGSSPKAATLRSLERLQRGGGISEREWHGMAEKCQKCGDMFATHVFKTHLKGCDGAIVVNSDLSDWE